MADVVASIVGRCCGGGVGIREIHSIAHGPVLEWRFKLNKQEYRHVDGSKRKIRKKETEGGQEPALDPCVGLQGGTRRGQAVLQPVREKDLRLDSVARSRADGLRRSLRSDTGELRGAFRPRPERPVAIAACASIIHGAETRVVPENPIRADSRDEGESGHPLERCFRSSICLGRLSSICSSRGAGLKSRTFFFDISSILP